MATLKDKWKLAAVPRKMPDNTRNNKSENTLNPAMAEEYFTQVPEEIEEKVTKNLYLEISRTGLLILGDLSKLDKFQLNPQVRICSLAVPGTSRNNISAN